MVDIHIKEKHPMKQIEISEAWEIKTTTVIRKFLAVKEFQNNAY